MDTGGPRGAKPLRWPCAPLTNTEQDAGSCGLGCYENGGLRSLAMSVGEPKDLIGDPVLANMWVPGCSVEAAWD
jgi:hypothetical protein